MVPGYLCPIRAQTPAAGSWRDAAFEDTTLGGKRCQTTSRHGPGIARQPPANVWGVGYRLIGAAA